MSKPSKVPFSSGSGAFAKGSKQGIKSPAGKPSHTANKGQGTGQIASSAPFVKAQVTGLKKGGSSMKTGGGKGPSGKS